MFRITRSSGQRMLSASLRFSSCVGSQKLAVVLPEHRRFSGMRCAQSFEDPQSAFRKQISACFTHGLSAEFALANQRGTRHCVVGMTTSPCCHTSRSGCLLALVLSAVVLSPTPRDLRASKPPVDATSGTSTRHAQRNKNIRQISRIQNRTEK